MSYPYPNTTVPLITYCVICRSIFHIVNKYINYSAFLASFASVCNESALTAKESTTTVSDTTVESIAASWVDVPQAANTVTKDKNKIVFFIFVFNYLYKCTKT